MVEWVGFIYIAALPPLDGKVVAAPAAAGMHVAVDDDDAGFVAAPPLAASVDVASSGAADEWAHPCGVRRCRRRAFRCCEAGHGKGGWRLPFASLAG